MVADLMLRTQSWSWFLLAVCLPVAAFAAAATRPSKPNILWISAEDLSPDFGCYGDKDATTPNLDRFALQGVRFDKAFSSAPVCSPSRSSIITGMYASSVGTHNHRSDVIPPTYVRCFTEYLRAAGYFCTNNLKTDYNFSVPGTAWDQNGKNAHWRNRESKDQPFFAVFNLLETHESRDMNLNGEYTHLTDELSPAEKHDPAKLKLPAYYPDTPIVRANWARWYDCVTVMDRRAGELLKELEKDGLAENTIVFFWGDHGRGLPRGKRWAYDSGLRVPLIVRWPGQIEAGSVREDLVSLMDLGPTLLSLAVIEAPAHMQGRAFLGDLQKPAPPYIFSTRDRMDEVPDMIRSVRDGRYRYIRNFQPEKPYAQPIQYMDNSPIMQEWRRLAGEGKLTGAPALFFAPHKPVEELYDEQEDPNEVRNLAADPQQRERIAAMRSAMVKWMEQIDDKGFVPELAEPVKPKRDREHPRTLPPVATVAEGHVKLDTVTAGSSIAYTLQSRPNARWKLYTGPMELKPGETLRAKACRAGFDESDEIRVPE